MSASSLAKSPAWEPGIEGPGAYRRRSVSRPWSTWHSLASHVDEGGTRGDGATSTARGREDMPRPRRRCRRDLQLRLRQLRFGDVHPWSRPSPCVVAVFLPMVVPLCPVAFLAPCPRPLVEHSGPGSSPWLADKKFTLPRSGLVRYNLYPDTRGWHIAQNDRTEDGGRLTPSANGTRFPNPKIPYPRDTAHTPLRDGPHRVTVS